LSRLDSKLEANKMFDLSGIEADLGEWEASMNKLHYDEALYKEISEKSKECLKTLQHITKELKNEIFTGRERKFEFDTKYVNIFDAFYKHIGFNT
jgi:hypothetical protein